MMRNILQGLLLIVGGLALVVLIIEITLSAAATAHGNTAARIMRVMAGPYPLTVSLYKDPADAGFALPFAIASQQSTRGSLTFDVTSLPGKGVDATPIHASTTPDANRANGVQGTAEIPVQGIWNLQVVVTGPAGHGAVNVPIRASAPPAVPQWIGWLAGLTPLYGLLIFLLIQQEQKQLQEPIHHLTFLK